jgi:hypothetical protein
MANRTIAAFGLGEVCPPNLAKNMSAIQKAGWTTVIVSLFHIDASGNLGINDTMITNNGNYTGNPDWPGQLQQLLKGPGTTITTLEASIGGWDVQDFANVKTIYQKNKKSFDRTLLQKTFKTFFDKFPAIRLIDMDMENTYDQASFVAFCQMLIKIGFGITFCPYDQAQQSFWANSLAALNKSNPGAVKWWNLQCYAGGVGNDPKNWADAISKAIPGFNTKGFILASDWSRNLAQPDKNPSTWYWEGDCPPAVQQLLARYAKEPSVSGAFLWNIDQILNYAADQKKKPDPQSCGVVGMTDYVAAMKKALG